MWYVSAYNWQNRTKMWALYLKYFNDNFGWNNVFINVFQPQWHVARAKWRVLTWSIVSTNFSSVTERTTAATTGTKTSAFAVSTVFLITRLLILHYCNYCNNYCNTFEYYNRYCNTGCMFGIASGIAIFLKVKYCNTCLLYTSPSPRD